MIPGELTKLQQLFSKKGIEASLEQLEALCSQYEVEELNEMSSELFQKMIEVVEAQNHCTRSYNKSGESEGVADVLGVGDILTKTFQKAVQEESNKIVSRYLDIPSQVQDAVINKMLAVKKEQEQGNTKEKYLKEADYAYISEMNVLSSLKTLRVVLISVLGIISILLVMGLLDNMVRSLTYLYVQEKGAIEYVQD